MAKQTIRIESIFGGETNTEFFSSEGQFRNSYGIDPDFPKDDSSIQTSGMLRPTAMAKFSGTEITGVPLWIVPSPKGTDTAVYANDGKVHIVTSSMAMGTALNSGTALTSSSGNGAAYYDNYWYFAKNTDIARYGRLDGTPSLTQTYWTGTLAKTALTNTTYPSIRGIAIPNHPMHRHTDGKLYIGDVVGNRGVLHYISTSKTTNEGDTDDGSTYNAIDFPYGYYPTAIETYGTDLVIGLIEGVDTTVKQKRAKLSFWDTTSTSFYKLIDVEFPDPLITAIKNINGVLWVFSGNASGGVRVSKFSGGYAVEEVAYFEEGVPPFQGAVDGELNRVIWGGYITDPESMAVVHALGSKITNMGMGKFTPFVASNTSSTNEIVTAVKYLEQANNSRLRPIIGWSDNVGKGLDKITTTYTDSRWDSPYYRIGQKFIIKKISLPLHQAMASNMTLTPTVYIDNLSSSTALTTINATNYPNSEKLIDLYPDVYGNHGFYISLKWTGTALLTVGLPITIEIELLDD